MNETGVQDWNSVSSQDRRSARARENAEGRTRAALKLLAQATATLATERARTAYWRGKALEMMDREAQQGEQSQKAT